jgi:hypothetical protein
MALGLALALAAILAPEPDFKGRNGAFSIAIFETTRDDGTGWTSARFEGPDGFSRAYSATFEGKFGLVSVPGQACRIELEARADSAGKPAGWDIVLFATNGAGTGCDFLPAGLAGYYASV